MSAKHIGLRGTPCQCSPYSRMKALRGQRGVCPCHGQAHAKCPDAHSCLGDCGRMTTAHETNVAGYCAHCAADRRWVKVA